MTESTTTQPSPYQPMFDASRPALEDLANRYNSIVAQLKNASVQDRVNEVLTDHQGDENIDAWRKMDEELKNALATNLEKIEAYVKEHILDTSEVVDVEKLTAEAREVKKSYTDLSNGLKSFAGGNDFVESLPKLPNLKGGGNTGQERARWAKLEVKPASDPDENYTEVYEDQPIKDKDGKVTGEFKRVNTFTTLARKLKELSGEKQDVATIYEHANAEKGDGTRPFTFAVGKYLVRATPKVSDGS
jgi:hypothetical protein